MACTVHIPFWPNSTDCLSWSADNQIVVTGGEYVAVLIPRLKERGPNGSLWDTVPIKVNAFTEKELPIRDPPLSTKNFSIGEDLSTRQAIEAKWSPPGLTVHKGCALAILTANHVLSIWAPIGRSQEAKHWKRQFVVNHTIAEYYENKAKSQQAGTLGGIELEEHIHISQRVRSFAWSPSVMRNDRDRGKEEHYLAVSTGGEEILFLRIVSPHSEPVVKVSEWKVNVMAPLRLATHMKDHIQDNARNAPFADYLSWNQWKVNDSGGHTIQLAYICGGRLFSTWIHTQSNDFTIESSRMHLKGRSDVTGPIRFVPGDHQSSLIAFGEDTVFHVDLDANADTFRTHHLDDRWDEMSGLAFTNPGDGSTLMHITSLLSMSAAATTTLSLPLQDDEISVQPAWQHAISESKAVYGTDHDIGGQVLERTFGIASSPMGDYIATCTAMHPSDCVEYVIQSDQMSVLNITWESESSESNLLPAPFTTAPPLASSAECLLFSLSRQVERYAESESDGPVDINSGLLKAEVLLCNPFRNDMARSEPSKPQALDDNHGLYLHLRNVLYADPTVLAAQASRIVDIALKPKLRRAEIARPIVQQLVQEILTLPVENLKADTLSGRIRAIFAVVSAKLSASEEVATNDALPDDLQSCQICHQPIPFESLMWAKCASGHQLSRCALSFLPIQEPGTTKSCGICGLQYLKEKVFSAFDPATEDIEMAEVPSAESNTDAAANDTWVEVSRNPNASPQPTRTLAQMISAACDVCIYCGGKFVD